MRNFILLLLILSSLSLIAQENIIAGYKMIIDKEANLYFNNSTIHTSDIMLHSKRYMDEGADIIKVTLASRNSTKHKFMKKMWSNFSIFKDLNFDLIVENGHLANPESSWSRFPTIQYYYIECRNKDTGILENVGAYSPGENRLKIPNYEDLADKDKAIFNYDFIVENESVYLLIQQDYSIYIYMVKDTSLLPNPEWRLLHCVESPFSHEYFVITKSMQKDYVIHTLSQGEFRITNFMNGPEIEKINNKILEGRVFVEDRRSDKTYELTVEEGNSLISSQDHVTKLTAILVEK